MKTDILSASVVIDGLDDSIDLRTYFNEGTFYQMWSAGDPVSARQGARIHQSAGCLIPLKSSSNEDDLFLIDKLVDSFCDLFEVFCKIYDVSGETFELQFSVVVRVSDLSVPALSFPTKFIEMLAKLRGSIDIDIVFM